MYIYAKLTLKLKKKHGEGEGGRDMERVYELGLALIDISVSNKSALHIIRAVHTGRSRWCTTIPYHTSPMCPVLNSTSTSPNTFPAESSAKYTSINYATDHPKQFK